MKTNLELLIACNTRMKLMSEFVQIKLIMNKYERKSNFRDKIFRFKRTCTLCSTDYRPLCYVEIHVAICPMIEWVTHTFSTFRVLKF